MDALRTILSRNQTAVASLCAGVGLCLLAAFVLFGTADRELHNRLDAPLSASGSARSALAAPVDSDLRDGLQSLAASRVEVKDSWKTVLDWAAGTDGASSNASTRSGDASRANASLTRQDLPEGSGRAAPGTISGKPASRSDERFD
ncbi:MAG: hypothetical protein AB7G88_09700 [Thermomicrobiales bacterium]